MSLNRPNPEKELTAEEIKREIQSTLKKERELIDAIDTQLCRPNLARALFLFPPNVLTPGQELVKEAAKPVEKPLEERLKDAQEYFHGVDYRLEESKRELEQLTKRIEKLKQEMPELVKEHAEAEARVKNLTLQVNEKPKKKRWGFC